MCKYKVQEGWNCERLIRTVIVSSISKYKDSFVNDKDNTWDDLGCRDTFRPLHQLMVWRERISKVKVGIMTIVE